MEYPKQIGYGLISAYDSVRSDLFLISGMRDVEFIGAFDKVKYKITLGEDYDPLYNYTITLTNQTHS